MKEEVLRVLKLVEEGRINPEKATKLIEVLSNNEKIKNINAEYLVVNIQL